MFLKRIYPFYFPILLIASILLSTSAYCISEKQKVVLYLDLFGMYVGQELEYDQIESKLKMIYPERQFRKILVSKKSDLEIALNNILDKDEQISNLFVDAHGSTDESEKRKDGRPPLASISFIEIGSEILGFHSWNEPEIDTSNIEDPQKVHLKSQLRERADMNNQEALKVFSGIHGRFTFDSQIVFRTCNLLQGTAKMAQLKAETIQKILGQTSGSLYGNSTYGYLDIAFKPFWLGRGIGRKLVSGCLQAGTALLGAKCIYTVANQENDFPYLGLAFAATGYAYHFYNISKLNHGYKIIRLKSVTKTILPYDFWSSIKDFHFISRP